MGRVQSGAGPVEVCGGAGPGQTWGSEVLPWIWMTKRVFSSTSSRSSASIQLISSLELHSGMIWADWGRGAGGHVGPGALANSRRRGRGRG